MKFLQIAEESTTVIEALNRFVNNGVSALPIVDDEGRLTNIYSKFDVINLAATKSYDDLEITLKEATQHKIYFDGVHCCTGKHPYALKTPTPKDYQLITVDFD